MKIQIALVTLAACLAQCSQYSVAQDPLESSLTSVQRSDSDQDLGQFNFSTRSVDVMSASDEGSASTTRFQTEMQPTNLEMKQSAAQRNIVYGTLQIIGVAALVCGVIIGALVYYSRRDPHGFANRRSLDRQSRPR